MNNRCSQVVIVAVKWSGDCGMIGLFRRGRVCFGLRGEMKWSGTKCWSVSTPFYGVVYMWWSIGFIK